MRYQAYINDLEVLMIDKIGSRRTPARISLPISTVFATFLRRRFRFAGRWMPRNGADHEKFLIATRINFTKFCSRLEVPYRPAVVQFKIRGPRQITYLNGRRTLRTILSRIAYLDCRFSCEQAPDEN